MPLNKLEDIVKELNNKLTESDKRFLVRLANDSVSLEELVIIAVNLAESK